MQKSHAMQALEKLFSEHGTDLPLTEALAWIAYDENAQVEPATILAQLDNLFFGFSTQLTDHRSIISAFNTHLYDTLGFCGDRDKYHDPSNALLDQVIIRRKGLPIMLSVIYMELGKKTGVQIDGIGFPGHFCVQLKGTDYFIDPFQDGIILEPEDIQYYLDVHFPHQLSYSEATRVCSPIEIVIRCNNNLFNAHQMLKDHNGMLRSISRNLMLQPQNAELHKYRALLLRDMGNYVAAAEALEHYLQNFPDSPDTEEVLQELSLLRGIG